MHRSARRTRRSLHWLAAAATAAALAIVAGCASVKLAGARQGFYAGDLDAAHTHLAELPAGNTDKALYLMERGMVRQAAGDYLGSARDWIEAAETAEELDYISVTRGSASFVANDRVMAFRGLPYERTLLHAFTAKSYLALGLWDDAAVEARNMVERLENLAGFPDDAYSHYLAGFCFESIGDREGAALQYRLTSELLEGLRIDDATGRLGPADGPSGVAAPPEAELVCFVLIGRSPSPGAVTPLGNPPYAELRAGDNLLGRSYALGNTRHLRAATEAKLAARRIAKDATRVVLKQATAEAIARENEVLGSLVWLVLFALEAPDTRRWQTLPLWLEVARVPCPADLQEFGVVLRGPGGQVTGRQIVRGPLTRYGRTFVSFCRFL